MLFTGRGVYQKMQLLAPLKALFAALNVFFAVVWAGFVGQGVYLPYRPVSLAGRAD
tara:strand:- start:40 stop:207 length:168 start_codon:yes stop_codon:yes gene_type:complete